MLRFELATLHNASATATFAIATAKLRPSLLAEPGQSVPLHQHQ